MSSSAAKTNAPRVSIVIPCWNAAPWLRKAIDSALAQTYANIEVIVIDDGSTDASPAIIASYGDRLRWESGSNRGGGAARNRGLRMAGGAHVLFLDADDVLFPRMLERMIAATRSAPPGAAPLCDREDEFESGPQRPGPSRNHYDGVDPVVFLSRASPGVSSILHRRSDLTAIGGFDEDLPCCQDKDLHLRLAARGMQLVAVPEILFQVRRRAGSVSSSYVKVLQQHVGVFLRLRDELTRTGQLTPARVDAMAHALSRGARHLVRAGEPHLAEASFVAATRIKAHGDRAAFHHPLARTAAAVLGPLRTEQLIGRTQTILGD